LRAANAAVVDLARSRGLQDEVGTTLAAVAIGPSGLHWISAGDTRIYLCRRSRLHRVNPDHAFRRVLLRRLAAGELSANEVASHPDVEALTSSLGSDAVPEVDQSLRPVALLDGDRVLICSDGLYRTLGEAEIERLLQQTHDVPAQRLVDATLQRANPRQDNVTVIGLTYLSPGASAGHSPAAAAEPGLATPRRTIASAPGVG
jgi:PPM family protein phosphatase